jgi:hypothetical protein
MKKSVITLIALATVALMLGPAAPEAKAATHVGATFVAHGGYPSYHSSYHRYGYGHHRRPCHPPVYVHPPVVVPFPGHPPVVHPPVYRSHRYYPYSRYHHYPSSRIYYRGPGFGISIGF